MFAVHNANVAPFYVPPKKGNSRSDYLFIA